MTSTVTMIDATGSNARNIPATAVKVAGYSTGSGGVAWTGADWAMFPHAGYVRIDQDANASDPLGSDAFDVEFMAGRPAQVPGWVKTRITHGIPWSTIYATDAVLAACVTALEAAGPHGWYAGHVDCWLADWNLDEHEAAALVGTRVHGLTCRAVQWASPTSNPHAVVPGSHLTLAEANVDLSVAEVTWHLGKPKPEPPPAPAHAELEGILVTLPGGTSRKVLSRDGGKSWT